MKKKYYYIIVALFLTACSSKHTIVIDNQKYTLVKDAVYHSNNITDIPLYVNQHDKTYYYTPSLNGKNMIPLSK